MSTLVREVCQFLRLMKVFTTPYHPQCNGQVENFHKTLKNGLALVLHGWGKICYKHMG